MTIIKSLPWRKVSRDEALVNHIENAPPEELTALRTRYGKAMRFYNSFQSFGLARYFGLRNTRNRYEEASRNIADTIAVAGRAACGVECGMKVYHRTEMPGETVTYLKPQCEVDGCPEAGLRFAENQFHQLPARAQMRLSQFDISAPQE